MGASGNTALYTPPTTLLGTGTWVAGPVIPGGLGNFDTPAAIMPNGDVLLVTGAINGTTFPPPTVLFEYNPNSNTISPLLVPPALAAALSTNSPFATRVIVMPSGQVLLALSTVGQTGNDRQLWAFTPNGGPQDAWRPTISNIFNNGNGSLTLTGTQLNGLSEGSLYGDDAQNATNYPIIRITDSTGRVFFARTFNWSSTGVATGNALVSTQFTLPAGLAQGPTTFVVIANGIPSRPFVINPVSVYFPFRYVYSPSTGLYTGFLTLQDNSPLSVGGTFVLFLGLPAGVTLANPTGFSNGRPFLAVQGALTPHGAPLRITIQLADPLRIPLSTFYIGFPVQVIVL
jgi:hypothetical protein